MIMSALGDSAVEVRLEALRAIVSWRDENTVRTLIHLLRDPHASVREGAILEITKIGARECIPDILPCLCDSAMPVRTAAVNGLSALGWRAETSGERALEFVGHSQFGKAAMLGRVALELLLSFADNPVVSTRQEIAEALGVLRDAQSITALQKFLSDADAGVRIAAILSISRVQPSVGLLSTMIKDVDKNVRIVAVETLGQLHDTEAVPALSECLQDSHWEVRATAANALGLLGERSTVPLLVNVLKDSDPDMRVAVAEALGMIGDVETIEPLILALLDPETPVRQAALKALMRVDHRWYRNPRAHRTLPVLKRATRGEDYSIRAAATDLLERIFSIRRHAIRNASGNPDVDRRILAGEVLVICLWDDDPLLAGAAAETLGHLRSRTAIEALKAKSQDGHPWVRKQAAAAVATLEGRESNAGWRPSSPRS